MGLMWTNGKPCKLPRWSFNLLAICDKTMSPIQTFPDHHPFPPFPGSPSVLPIRLWTPCIWSCCGIIVSNYPLELGHCPCTWTCGHYIKGNRWTGCVSLCGHNMMHCWGTEGGKISNLEGQKLGWYLTCSYLLEQKGELSAGTTCRGGVTCSRDMIAIIKSIGDIVLSHVANRLNYNTLSKMVFLLRMEIPF